MVEAGFQPDQRLDYLAAGYTAGDFVVFAMVDRAGSRAADIARAGARLRWTFRSIEAVSFVASRRTLLDLARRPWVKALYPVWSGAAHDDTAPIAGTISQGMAPRVHDVTVPAGAAGITVDLAVTPPNGPHFDWNLTDFLEARLVDPRGQTVMVRPSSFGQVSFRYAGTALEAGTWKLEIWHRRSNQPLPVSSTFVYAGAAVAWTSLQPPRLPVQHVPTPTATCTGTRDAAAWRGHPNLKRRGVSDIGAPVAWDAGIRGRGVRLAILDTGVDATHVDLDDDDFERWGEQGCAPKVIADALFQGGRTLSGLGASDVGSHGTHVAGEAAGTAEGSADGTRAAYPGVAPEASLLAGRIAIDITALTDDMLAAAEWAVIDQRADVVNMSFGIDPRAGVLNDANDPQSAGFEALATNPAWGWPTITISASNNGDLFNSVGLPAAAPHVYAVAAAVKDWDLVLKAGEKTESGLPAVGAKDAAGKYHPSIAGFSSRGPSADYAFTPDIAAPGRRIVAPLTNQNSDGIMDGYVSYSGTSMAAPHAAGAAALLVDGYRRRFGTGGPFDGRPASWLVGAALSNTAGIPASRPGYMGGPLAKVSYAPGADGLLLMFAEGNARENLIQPLPPVGPLVEGAGRINIPAALDALTGGVVVYTDGSEHAPKAHELQPQFAAGTAKPGDAVTRRFRLHPATKDAFTVSFRAAAGVASMNSNVIPVSWWQALPSGVSVSGGAVPANVTLRVPAGTAPGSYTGYVLADVAGPRGTTTLRIPAMVVVEIADYDAAAGAGATVDHATMIAGGQGSYTGALGFLAGVADLPIADGVVQDMPTFAVEVPEGATSLDLAIDGRDSFRGAAGSWDLFVYDRTGVVVADTSSSQAQSLSIPSPAPGTYRIAVALAEPSARAASFEDPRGVPFRLSVDLVGAATAKPPTAPVVAGAPPRPGGELPATGVPAAVAALGVLLLATAATVRRALRD